MARPLRIEFEGAVYHIISKGNEEKDIFIDNKDYRKFLYYLGIIESRYKLRVYSYCLMRNHYHLLIETIEPNLSRAMRDLNGHYTIYFNRRHVRFGHLFGGRYKAILVDKENYLLELSRYIHLNPVRANVVDKPEDYSYSSMINYLNEEMLEPWIDIEYILGQFGRNANEQRNEYRKFVYDGLGRENEVLNKTYSNAILGSEKFVKNITSNLLYRKEISQEVPHSKKLRYPMELDDIANCVMNYYKIDRVGLAKRSPLNRAKKVFVYLVRKYTDSGFKEMQSFLDSRTSTSGLSRSYSRFEKEMGNSKELELEIKSIEKSLTRGSISHKSRPDTNFFVI